MNKTSRIGWQEPGSQRPVQPRRGSRTLKDTGCNPFYSLGRRLFLLVVGPATAFLALAVLYHLGANDYHYIDSGTPVRTVTVSR